MGKQMEKRMILLDLDGTLLHTDKSLSAANRRVLEACAARGIYVVPATGRFYAGIPEPVRTLPFVRYFICVNGAQIYDRQTQQVLHRDELPLPLSRRIFDCLQTFDATYECYLDGWGYLPAAFYGRLEYFIPDAQIRDMVRRLRRPVEDFFAFLDRQNKPLQKIQSFFRREDERQEALRLLPELFPQAAVSSSVAGSIELTNATATKGEALRWLCRRLDVAPAQTVAFGDSSNDASMLEAAGLGVAMANADESLRRSAGEVTLSNDEDGVAATLERLFLRPAEEGNAQ